MDRLEFRRIRQAQGLFSCRTSGSTGIGVLVQKYREQQDNLVRHTRLFNTWHDFEPNASILKLSPPYKEPKQKKNILYSNKYIQGDYRYLVSYPQMFPTDLFQFEKIVSYGTAWTGIGIDLYSSEEFGYIAVQCPHNPYALHIMDNLEITFTDNGMRITDLSHPCLKDYEIGDWAEPIVCNCGIKLPAMSHVKGRVRNMIKMPDGSSHWPIYGLYKYEELERFQVFQESLTKLRVHIIGTMPEEALKTMRSTLGYDFEIEVIQGNFKPGKYEEFICEI